ncbi:ALPHABET ISOFORM E-RELATED [Salix purpurea]|uniref:ALPHABET ISOFORM E-RELATED n=1 Tax=Salix purpurea TaxID=77065 RepID=A0A9Q1A9V4_SALPP|nr:ALPHABET ISOFORM E-RELATED [Salix purpurea]
MARAFGDFCLKDFGLISVPDISYRHLTEKDEFIVLATDGIWDVLSNKEAVDIVASVSSRSSAAKSRGGVSSSSLESNEQLTSADQADNGRQKEDDLPCPACPDRAGGMWAEKEALSGGNAEEDSAKQDEMQSECGIEWSALEGVSRVNTMLNLPRFVPGKEGKKAAGEAKTGK